MVAPPPRQSQRLLGFLLTGAPGGDQAFAFGLKPEDLTQNEPSRLTVQQTIGGAWADVFDRGVARISINGTTGWRGTLTTSGEDMFANLRDTVFTGWHQARADAIASGNDPETVELFFTDSLDGITALVAPVDFQLHRSKTSPLMIRYRIDLVVLDDAVNPDEVEDRIALALADPQRWVLAVINIQSILLLIPNLLAAAIGIFAEAAAFVTGFIGAIVGLVTGIIGIAQATIGLFIGAEVALLSIGRQIAFAAEQAFNIIAADITLTIEEAYLVADLAASFGDIGCSLVNGFNLIGQFPSYDGFRGASHCSSTSGGDPISPFTAQSVSAFSYAAPASVASVTLTPDAQAAIDGLSGDPLFLIGQNDEVYDMMRRTADGVAVA